MDHHILTGMILAGDIGGTKTNLALFDGDRREPLELETFASREHDGLEPMVKAFLARHPAEIEAASFGVAGPVKDGVYVDTTNLAWPVEGDRIARLVGLERIGLLNDLEANAWGIAALTDEDFAVLNPGDPEARGNAAVISAGTGLGEAGLYFDGSGHRPFATEGGHADFAPRSDLEVELWRFLHAKYGHVSYERVCSGMGLVNIERFLRSRSGEARPVWLEQEMAEGDSAAAISGAALDRSDAVCDEALDLLVSIYGAAAGNLVLKLMATGGVYLGGGIAPKILPRLRGGLFMRAFEDKGRFDDLLARIPVRVILNDQAALIGAARHAATL
jgi:glucokinase